MIPIFGGKLDGQWSPLTVVTFEEKGESYILMEWQEKLDGGGSTRHRFYVLTGDDGMAPAEAVKRYKVLRSFEKLK